MNPEEQATMMSQGGPGPVGDVTSQNLQMIQEIGQIVSENNAMLKEIGQMIAKAMGGAPDGPEGGMPMDEDEALRQEAMARLQQGR